MKGFVFRFIDQGGYCNLPLLFLFSSSSIVWVSGIYDFSFCTILQGGKGDFSLVCQIKWVYFTVPSRFVPF